MTETVVRDEAQPSRLRRELHFWEAIALSIAIMAPTAAMALNGVGIAGLIGRAVPLAFLFALIGVLFVSYAFAMLTREVSHAGSVYALTGFTLGARAGFLAGWALLGTYLCFTVASSAEVGDKPLGLSVLDERLAVYRVKDRVVALKDLCIHRGTPLSRGLLDDDGCLVCAYHGWTFAPDGACVRIPALDAAQPIPRKARVAAHRTAERYGLVWVCLDEPCATIPPINGSGG